MPLHNIFAMDGLPLVMYQGRILQIRLVSKQIMMALESNFDTDIVFHISEAGVDSLTVDFLHRWNGRMHLECRHPWTPESPWFQVVRTAFSFGRRRPMGLVSLSVGGKCLHLLAATLAEEGTAIKELEISYTGSGKELAATAAPIASLVLSFTVTMAISVEKCDPLCSQLSSWLQRMDGWNIRIKSMTLR
jgi:hypothetical protein